MKITNCSFIQQLSYNSAKHHGAVFCYLVPTMICGQVQVTQDMANMP